MDVLAKQSSAKLITAIVHVDAFIEGQAPGSKDTIPAGKCKIQSFCIILS